MKIKNSFVTIQNNFDKYRKEVGSLDLELIISHVLRKSREFVVAHPEYEINKNQEARIKNYAAKRVKREPLAYILGHKEFYGLDFKVNKNTLIPRPETELLVEKGLFLLRNMLAPWPRSGFSGFSNNVTVIDVGTGSGNIITSITRNLQHTTGNKINFYGTDISKEALAIARHNAKKYKLDKKIKFVKSNLLYVFIKNLKLKTKNYIIIANLPYLSKKIYQNSRPDVKNYEPRSALYAPKNGLYYYEKLFQQIKKMPVADCKLWVIMEFSPEQKNKIKILSQKHFPASKIIFQKDLAGKWRIGTLKIC